MALALAFFFIFSGGLLAFHHCCDDHAPPASEACKICYVLTVGSLGLFWAFVILFTLGNAPVGRQRQACLVVAGRYAHRPASPRAPPLH